MVFYFKCLRISPVSRKLYITSTESISAIGCFSFSLFYKIIYFSYICNNVITIKTAVRLLKN
jgi:hypothetical protein